MALTQQQALARLKMRRRRTQQAGPQEDYGRPSMEWGADLVTSTKPTAIQESATGATLGAAGGTLKSAGAVTQLATGGRLGRTLAETGEKLSEAGGKVAPVSTFVGEVAAPVAGVKKASTLLNIGKKGLSTIQKVLRSAGIGAVALPAAMPVKDADQMSVSDFFAEKGQQAGLGAIGGAALFGAGKIAGAATGKLMDLVGNRTIKQAREIIERYRVKNLDELEKAIRAEDEAVAKTRAQREQIAAGQTKRETRAQAKVEPGAPKEKQRVLDVTRQRERAAQEALRDAEIRSVNANDAIVDLEQRIVAGGGKEREKLGSSIRKIAKGIQDKYTARRNETAKFNEMIQNSPVEANIPTLKIQQDVGVLLKDINNPVEQKLFEDIKNRLGGDIKKLNVRQADSLKTYLNTIIHTKQHGQTPLDSAIVSKVMELKKELVNTLKNSYAPYKEAFEAYGPASRPLDIVERNGALKKVLDQDPLSAEYRLTESEVAGAAIRRANAGSPVFSRLLTEDPSIQEPARLYFTRDLLGRGSPPTPRDFKTWLKNNENALKQLNLYDEFSTLAKARSTAQRAVETAKEVTKEATALRKAATKYVERAAGAGKTPAEIVAPATKRAEKRAGELLSQEQKIAKRADEFRKLEARLRAAREKDVPKEASKAIENLRASGLIDDAEYTRMQQQLGEIETTVERSRQAQNVRNMFYTSLVGGGVAAYLLRGGPATPSPPLPGVE